MSGSKDWSDNMHQEVVAYNAAHAAPWRAICERLAFEIERGLPYAEGKVWHGGPVWFDRGNPLVGYWVRKHAVQLLFWSGQSFGETGLAPEGKFKAAEVNFATEDQIDSVLLLRWLEKARDIQWDYKNIVKRKGVLEKLKGL